MERNQGCDFLVLQFTFQCILWNALSVDGLLCFRCIILWKFIVRVKILNVEKWYNNQPVLIVVGMVNGVPIYTNRIDQIRYFRMFARWQCHITLVKSIFVSQFNLVKTSEMMTRKSSCIKKIVLLWQPTGLSRFSEPKYLLLSLYWRT